MPTERTSTTRTKSRLHRQAGKPAQTKPNQTGPPDPCSMVDPRLYVDRELSLLAFQKRVLEEAQDNQNPLLERVKFLSIFGSNLDEFFMVRVAGLMRQAESGVLDCGPDGMTPKQQLTAIHEVVLQLFKTAQDHLRQEILPALTKAGVFVMDYSQLTTAQRTIADKYFLESVFPALTPLAFDPGRPFPHISNPSLNLAVLLRDGKGAEHFARVKVPDILPQLVPVTPMVKESGAGKKKTPTSRYLLWLEQ